MFTDRKSVIILMTLISYILYISAFYIGPYTFVDIHLPKSLIIAIVLNNVGSFFLIPSFYLVHVLFNDKQEHSYEESSYTRLYTDM